MLVSIGLTAAIHGARLQKNVSVKRSGPRPKTKPTEPRPRRIASWPRQDVSTSRDYVSRSRRLDWDHIPT